MGRIKDDGNLKVGTVLKTESYIYVIVSIEPDIILRILRVMICRNIINEKDFFEFCIERKKDFREVKGQLKYLIGDRNLEYVGTYDKDKVQILYYKLKLLGLV